ncbi:MAG TPA: sialate O-acetylesterase [Paludibacter sp.]|nr:sialate O-acetylesterase [Paludibacter sp.]
MKSILLMNLKKRLSLFVLLLLSIIPLSQLEAAPDPNFHIYICFGQSNMEGNAAIGSADRTGVNARFRVLTVAPDDYQHLGRTAGNWYTATPPLCRWDTGLTPADYFGRTLTDSLPDSIKVGVIVVAMGGSGIDAFDKDNYTTYYQNADAWQKSLMNIYGGNPYAKIIEMAKIAQQAGVVKGVLLHQGETNNMQADWPQKVQKIYNNMLADLGLAPNSVPLLAGEMLHQDQGGICWGMNSIIATLPYYIPNSYVISSDGCAGNGVDGFHFSTEGARELGARYGRKMLSVSKTYHTVAGQTVDHLQIGNTGFTLVTGAKQKIALNAVYADGHAQEIGFRAAYEISNPEVLRITNGFIETLKDGTATVTASYKGALGDQKQVVFNVTATTFPLTNELFNPNIFSTGSFDETTRTLKTGQWGFGGWQYAGVDLSGYKYVVAKLGSANNADIAFNLYDGDNYWGSPFSCKFGSKREVVVNLTTAKKNDGTPLDPHHIYIAGFWSTGAGPFIIDKVYLAKTDAELTATAEVYFDDKSEKVDVYSITGVLLRPQIERGEATDKLPSGIYILGNSRGFVKTMQVQHAD